MRAVLLGLIATSILAGVAQAKSPFDGTWSADLSSQKLPPHPDVYLLDHGRYRCDSCSPPRAYAADGKPHPVPGDPEVIWESVRAAGPRTMVTHIKEPAIDRVTTMTVSADGRTATYVSLDHRPDIKGPLRSEYLARRVAPAPPGAHPVSGSWQGVRYVTVPWQVSTVELHDDGEVFTYSTPIGVGFTARYDGPATTVKGPFAGKAEATVRRLGADVIEERRTDNGQLAQVRTYVISPDGASLTMATTNGQNGSTSTATYRRSAARH